MNILTIAGSDPSSGAGIQNDIKVFTNLGHQSFSVITAITSQNTSSFLSIEPVSIKSIKSQIDSILSDFTIDAIKIGVVYNSANIKVIYSKIKNLKIPIILDPILESSTGGTLLQKNAISDYKKYLLPLSFVVTPNVKEAEIFSGRTDIKNKQDLISVAKKISEMGAKNIIITGFEEKDQIIDCVYLHDSKSKAKIYFISSKKINLLNHGSGCTYSAALVSAITKKMSVYNSIKFAKQYATKSIKMATKIGKGLPMTRGPTRKYSSSYVILPHSSSLKSQLQQAISDLLKIKNMYKLIPECQTNFVYSKIKPTSIKDVLGVQGRIVKSGKQLVVAGNLEFGGSQHVATAVLHVNKKFPQIRSAINIKFEPYIIRKLSKQNMIILSYDRRKEPSAKKYKENSTISWGMQHVMSNTKLPPDIIYHKGDFGKEPMILFFGKTPLQIIKKLSYLT